MYYVVRSTDALRPSRDRGRRRVASHDWPAEFAPPGEVASYILGFSHSLHSLSSTCFGHILRIRIASHRIALVSHCIVCLFGISSPVNSLPTYISGTPHQTKFKSARVVRFLCRDTKPPHDSAKPRAVPMGVEARMRFLSSCHNSSFCTQQSMSFVQLM